MQVFLNTSKLASLSAFQLPVDEFVILFFVLFFCQCVKFNIRTVVEQGTGNIGKQLQSQ